jgi:hypothetical protein
VTPSSTPGASPTATPTAPTGAGTPTVIATPAAAIPTLSFPGMALFAMTLALAGLLLGRR